MERESADAVLAELATRQHGVVSAAQAIAILGSRQRLEHRVRTGRLHRLHRGVYAVGHKRVSREGWWLAAVLACGPGAALSHRAAAALHGLRPAPGREPDVTVRGDGGRRRRRGLTVHRSVVLTDEHVTVVDAIPVTDVPWTLVDLAGVVREPVLARALEQAEKLRVFDRRALEDAVELRPAAPGTRVLRALLAAQAASSLTASDAEAALLALCRAHGLPLPSMNVALGPYVIDALWVRERLALEIDSRLHHETRAAFQRDRRRDMWLLAHGWRPARVTPEQLEFEQDDVVELLRGALAQPAVARTP